MGLQDDITPLLITFDEMPNIARTIGRLAWAKRIVVVDSGSLGGADTSEGHGGNCGGGDGKEQIGVGTFGGDIGQHGRWRCGAADFLQAGQILARCNHPLRIGGRAQVCNRRPVQHFGRQVLQMRRLLAGLVHVAVVIRGTGAERGQSNGGEGSAKQGLQDHGEVSGGAGLAMEFKSVTPGTSNPSNRTCYSVTDAR